MPNQLTAENACAASSGSMPPIARPQPGLLLVARVLVGDELTAHHLHGAVDEHVAGASLGHREERRHHR